ncbi:hypothetical protein [Streptomyces sennicomposti]|uniref:hypothetical protein n=1 Tax=Streptomyces sennicomposti TaxID=2873384 RepID=UPI001CA7469B|nr:hypothetical protein [Streptomyces sennicomposti]MBY8866640.1 hypothetical protein [Streptomyces sennicomposti]
MTYPMDEYPDDVWNTAASVFGPQGDLDPYVVQQQAQLMEDMQRDQVSGDGIFASTPSHSSPDSAPVSAGNSAARQRMPGSDRVGRDTDAKDLSEVQDEAISLLFDGLTRDQRDALLILSMGDGGALRDLLDALWTEYDDGLEDGDPGLKGT